jgi:CTP synthase (UTP-ammonia lyase)
VRAVPRLYEFYPEICRTTEEKARKNLSQGKRNLSQVKKNLSQSTVYILPKHPHKQTNKHTHTHTHIHTHTHTHTYITKQYKTTTVQIRHTARYAQIKVTI